MATLDLINSTLQDLKDSGIITFKRKHWFMDRVFLALRAQKPEGRYMERDLTVGSNARGKMIVRGDEVLAHTRYDVVRKIRVDPFRWAISPAIPKKDTRENVGPDAAIRLVDKYAMLPLQAYFDDLNQFILTGTTQAALAAAATQYRGVLCLNGDYASGVVRGTERGLLDFATFASQSDTVQDLGKDGSIFYANQWRHITNWGDHGMRMWEMAWRDAARYAQGKNKGPNVILTDPTTFSNYRDEYRSHVRVTVNGGGAQEKSSDSLLELTFGDGALVCCEHALDPSLFTTYTTGVTYMINTDGWERTVYEEIDIPPLTESMESQDAFVTHGADHFALMCCNVAAQAVVSGGNA